MKNLDYREYYRRNLPHFQPRGATFLVNFRLAGFLPTEVIERLKAESDEIEQRISKIMHNIKRNSAKQANQILGRTGKFWQHESYDYVVRDSAELGRIIKYVLKNPVQARLVEDWTKWEWSYCKYEV